MKKFILVALLGLTMNLSFAQDKGQDYITMKKGGKMYWIRSGQTIRMGISVPLKNGSMIYPNGVIKAKDGSRTQIKAGDRVLMDGTVIAKNS